MALLLTLMELTFNQLAQIRALDGWLTQYPKTQQQTENGRQQQVFFYPAYFAKRWSCISVILLYQTDNGQSLLLLVCAPEWLMSLYRDNSNINGMRWLAAAAAAAAIINMYKIKERVDFI